MQLEACEETSIKCWHFTDTARHAMTGRCNNWVSWDAWNGQDQLGGQWRN